MTTLVTELMAGRSLWFGLDYAPHPDLPEGGHVTLAYLGKLTERTEYYATHLAMRALEAIPRIAGWGDNLEGSTDGIARFAAERGDGALVVLVKFSGDWAWRMRDEAVGVKPVGVPRHWTPHVTLRYLTDDSPVAVPGLSPQPIKFTAVTLNCGDHVQKLELFR